MITITLQLAAQLEAGNAIKVTVKSSHETALFEVSRPPGDGRADLAEFVEKLETMLDCTATDTDGDTKQLTFDAKYPRAMWVIVTIFYPLKT